MRLLLLGIRVVINVVYDLFMIIVIFVHPDLFLRVFLLLFCFFGKTDQVLLRRGFGFFLLFCFLQLAESLEEGFFFLFVEDVRVADE